MARPGSETLTEREAQIMRILWERGRATADEVRRGLPVRLHDSTVRSLLRTLEQKGHVSHSTRGRIFIYRASVKRATAERKALRTVLRRFFGGSPEALVSRLLEDEQLTAGQLEELRSKAASEGRKEG